MSDPEKNLAAWLERLRMVARSSTASNIEPWDIGAFLVALNEWASDGANRIDSRCRSCGVLQSEKYSVHDSECMLAALERETRIDPKLAERT